MMEYISGKKVLLAVMAVAAALPSYAQGDPEFDAKIERMTDMVIEMSPMAIATTKGLALSAEWPLQGRAHLVSADELACLRNELSVTQLRKKKVEEVRAYALADSKRFAADFELLSTGISTLFANSVTAGIEAAQAGQRAVPSELMKDASGNQFLAMTLFTTDPKHQTLRELTGFDDAMKAASSSASPQSRQAANAAMFAKLIFSAMDACDIKPAKVLANEMNTAATRSGADAPNAVQFDAQCNRPAPEPLPANSKSAPPRVDPRNPNPFPEYPFASKRMGEEGAALINMYVTEEGEVSRAQLAKSSGSPRLDQAALEGTRAWRYLPGRVDGQTVCMWVTTSVNFKLKNADSQEAPSAMPASN